MQGLQRIKPVAGLIIYKMVVQFGTPFYYLSEILNAR